MLATNPLSENLYPNKLETQNSKLETRNSKLETRNSKPKTQNSKPFDLNAHYAALHTHPDKWLRSALQLMEERLAYNWQVAELAFAVGVSDRKLERLFHKEAWCPMEYLRQLRLAHAALALIATSDVINQIAAAVGYVDPHAFRRAFKRSYGRNPSGYRALYSGKNMACCVAPQVSENTPLKKSEQAVT